MTSVTLHGFKRGELYKLIKRIEAVGDGDPLGLALDEITKQSCMLCWPVAVLHNLEAVEINVLCSGVIVGEDAVGDLGHTALLCSDSFGRATFRLLLVRGIFGQRDLACRT